MVLRPNHVMMFVVGEQFLWPQFVSPRVKLKNQRPGGATEGSEAEKESLRICALGKAILQLRGSH